MKHKLSTITLAVLSATSLNFAASVHAQQAEEEVEVIEVTGIRTALASALSEKRNASNLKEIIQAEDIGKLPDNNLAEVLENITGVQITREQGVGTNVQIRGTSQNRVEINGVSSVGAAGSRTGISFTDLPAALISSLEVIKAPTAKTIEGSVGGTINLRTLRGNSLDERLLQFRVQGENSDLADSTMPRYSGTFGDNWETDHGKIGLVLTGSYAEQDVASINPRYDRDAVIHPDSGLDSAEDFSFMRIQFLKAPFQQKQYTTKNYTGSLEWEPSDDLKFYVDATVNDQEVLQSTTTLHGSGVSFVQGLAENTSFDVRNFGTIDSVNGPLDLGEMAVVTSGILHPGVIDRGAKSTLLDGNLRMEMGSTPRLTKSKVFAFGSEWTSDKLQVAAELSYSDSKQSSPTVQGQLDFINPQTQQPAPGTTPDNGTPFVFNSQGGFMEWGIAQGLSSSPTTADLLDPANYALRRVDQRNVMSTGDESSARIDLSYDVSDDISFFTDVHAGIRWNESSSTRNDLKNARSFKAWNRVRADLFSDVVAPGPNNFNGADSRTLYVPDYLTLSSDVAQNNPQQIIDSINSGIVANNALTGNTTASLSTPSVQTTSYFDITEESTALYVQGDFEIELGDVFVSGNLGVRHINTDVSSTGNATINGELTKSTQDSDFSFTLPRFNISAELTDDILVRAGIGKDIRRPGFNDLSTSTNYGSSPTQIVKVGNPALKPEEILSYDLSFEYYFAESSLASIGFFRKERKNLLIKTINPPGEFLNEDSGQMERYVDGDCSSGGIWNPNVPTEAYELFSSRTDTSGMCVPRESKENVSETETQEGVELAIQYDLSAFEEQLGWASGLGLIANYTYQKSSQSLDRFNTANARYQSAFGRTDGADGVYTTATLADDFITQRVVLDNLSKHSYNITAYYDKNDLSVRMRYTWRDAYTSTSGNTIGFLSPIIAARGQLNLSVSYDINEMVNIGVSGVNLTQEDSTVWCFNEGALLCEQNTSDRRITAGITVKL